jgi:replicative DNA helicase
VVDSERQLLGAWIAGYNQEHIKEFEYFNIYPEIFNALKELKDINIMSVAKKANTKALEIAKLVAEYMPSMYEGAYRQMKEYKIKTMIQDIAQRPDNIKEQLEKVYAELDTLSIRRIKAPSSLTDSYIKEIKERIKSQPLMYGIPKLDYVTGGLRNKELTVIAARPGIGKTALALQVAFNIALKDHKVLFFPLEMAASQLMERLVCRETAIQHEKLKTPSKLTDEDKSLLKEFMALYESVMNKNLCVIEDVSKLSEIKHHIEHYKPSIVFIDQLSQLRENKRFDSIRAQFTYMTNTLKAMSMELNVPIVLLAQINRDGQNREPTLADIKESGSIEEDADNVIMIHQDGEPIYEHTPMKIIIRKQRNGARDQHISVMYMNKKFVFREVKNE